MASELHTAVTTKFIAASTIRVVLQLNVNAVGVRKIHFWCATGCASTFRHASAHPVLKWRCGLSFHARCQAIIRQALQHGRFSKIFHVQARMIDAPRLCWLAWLGAADKHQKLVAVIDTQNREGALKGLILDTKELSIKVVTEFKV